MALVKAGYVSAIQGTSKVKIGIDENGYITDGQSGSAPIAGKKNFSISKVNADNNRADNLAVTNFFLNLAQGSYDSLSNTMQVTWESEK